MLLFMLFFVADGFAVTRTWDGGGGTLVWTTAANWSGDVLPVSGDDVVFNASGIYTITGVPSLSLNSLSITAGNVTFSSSSASTLTIGGNTGTDLVISNGASFILGTNLSITMASSSTADISGAFTINASRTWTITNSTNCTVGSTGSIINSGTITGATTAKLIFQGNSIYTHAQAAGTVPLATWAPTSTCTITGATTALPSGITNTGAQTNMFGNFIWDCPNQSSKIYFASGGSNWTSFTLEGSFTVNNTGNSVLLLGAVSGSVSRTFTVKGNFEIAKTGNQTIFSLSEYWNQVTLNVYGEILITGGQFYPSTMPTPTGETHTINVEKGILVSGSGVFKSQNQTGTNSGYTTINFTNTQGGGYSSDLSLSTGLTRYGEAAWNINIKSGRTVTLKSNIELGSSRILTVESGGALVLPASYVVKNNTSGTIATGTTFALNSGGILKIENIDGIASSGTTGGVQTNIRTFNGGGNYQYTATNNQVTGNALPASITGSLVINNTSSISGTGVSLSQATTIASPGILNLTAGVLTTTTNLLSITNTSANAITGGNSASFVNGPLRWTVANSGGGNYKFQVGKGGKYLPLNVGSPAGTLPVITVQAFNTNSGGSAGSGLESISQTEYWSISNTGTLTSSTISLGKENIGVNNAISSSTTSNGTYTHNLGTCSITDTLITSNTIQATNTSGTFSTPAFFVMSSKTCSNGTKYWAGAGSTIIGATNGTDFNVAANWSSTSGNKTATSAPASCHDVTMTTNAILNLTLSENTKIKSLTLTNGNNDVSLTATSPYNLEISSHIANTGNVSFGNNTSVILNGSVLQTVGSSNDKTLTFNNLQITNTNGVKVNVNVNVNGILNLNAANPNETDGLLDMVINYGDYATGAYTTNSSYNPNDPLALTTTNPDLKNSTSTFNNLNSYVLTLGANATVAGSGDVTGKIRRTNLANGVTYTFGNANTQLTFDSVNGSSLPTQITVVATRGNQGHHSDKENAVKRMFQILRTGGTSETRFTLRLPYEEVNLNANNEESLVLWDHHIPYNGVTPHEHGKTSNSVSNNYIELANHGLFYLATEGDVNFTKYWMISDQVSEVPTWVGAVPGGSWEVPSNWTSGVVPTNLSSIIIPSANKTPYDPVLLQNIAIGTVEIQADGIFSGGDKTITINGGPANNGGRGSWNNNGTFDAGTGTVVFNYTDATLAGSTIFNNFIVNSGKKVTIQGNTIATVNGTITISSSSAIETLDSSTLKVTNFSLNDTFTFENNGTLEVLGTLTDSRATKNYGGLVRYAATTGSQTVIGAAYNHLDLTAASTKLFSSDPTVAGNFTISEGSVTPPSLFVFNGNTTQNIVGLPYNNITFSGTGDKIFTSNGSISSSSAITFDSGAATIDFDGDGTQHFVLKSDSIGTARIGNVGNFNLTGKVSVERFLLNNANSRLWRLLTAPVVSGSNTTIFENWQNNGLINGVTGTDVWGPGSGYSIQNNGMYYLPISTHNFRKYINGAWTSVTNTKTEPLFTADKNNAFLTFIIYPAGSGIAPNGTGAFQGVPGAASTTLVAKGNLLSGTQNYTLNNTNYHLIGNPYASPIDFENLIASNGVNGNTITEKIWLLDPELGDFGNYVTWDPQAGYSNVNSVNHIAGAKIIHSGQGFFVKGKSGATSSNFEIKESDKIASNSYIFGRTTTNNYERIRVNLDKISNGVTNHKDACVAVFYNEASNAVTEKDVQKFTNPAETLSFYNGATSLSSEHRAPIVDNDILFIRLTQATANSSYKLKINTENFTFAGSAIFHDLKLGVVTLLPLDGSVFEYPFEVTSDPSTQGVRFKIVFTTTLSLEDNPNTDTITIYPNPTSKSEGITINLGTIDFGTYSYRIINPLGQEIQKGDLTNYEFNQEFKINFNTALNSGVYIFEVIENNKNLKTMKLLIE